MIDGLKLDVTADEIVKLIDKRIAEYDYMMFVLMLC